MHRPLHAPVRGHVYRHACRHAYRHTHTHAYRHGHGHVQTRATDTTGTCTDTGIARCEKTLETIVCPCAASNGNRMSEREALKAILGTVPHEQRAHTCTRAFDSQCSAFSALELGPYDLYTYGQYIHGLYSYGQYGYGLYSYGQYSYGASPRPLPLLFAHLPYSHGLCNYALCSHGLCSNTWPVQLWPMTLWRM